MREIKRIGLGVLLSVVLLLGCSCDTSNDKRRDSEDSLELSFFERISSFHKTSPSDEQSFIREEISEESAEHEVAYLFENEFRPETVSVTFRGTGDEELFEYVDIDDLYDIDVLSSGFYGGVGSPFSVTFPEEISDATITVQYDEAELRGTDEADLSVRYYDEEVSGVYLVVDISAADYENNTISFSIVNQGTYLLADPTFDGQVDYDNPTQYESDWEREADTGSIMEIADFDFAFENAPSFDVTSVEEFAGVVYYININQVQTRSDLCINVMNDIDFEGYSWPPMGTDIGCSSDFDFELNGNGHTLSNLTLDCPCGLYNGLFGLVLTVYVHDINIENAVVTGGEEVAILVGSCMDNEFVNVSASGSVTGIGSAGALAGYDGNCNNFTNCTINVTVNGNRSECYSSSADWWAIAEESVVEDYRLEVDENYSITRSQIDKYEDLTWRIACNGKVILERNANNEFSLNINDVLGCEEGAIYTVCLIRMNDSLQTFQRCSNTVEYVYRS